MTHLNFKISHQTPVLVCLGIYFPKFNMYFLKDFFFKFSIVNVCVCLRISICTCVQVPLETRDHGATEAGITGSLESPRGHWKLNWLETELVSPAGAARAHNCGAVSLIT